MRPHSTSRSGGRTAPSIGAPRHPPWLGLTESAGLGKGPRTTVTCVSSGHSITKSSRPGIRSVARTAAWRALCGRSVRFHEWPQGSNRPPAPRSSFPAREDRLGPRRRVEASAASRASGRIGDGHSRADRSAAPAPRGNASRLVQARPDQGVRRSRHQSRALPVPSTRKSLQGGHSRSSQ
jgi:hypothetical protein